MDKQPDQPLPADDDAPTGGTQTSEDQLQADNEVEQDMIESVDPGGTPD